jgi:hypothetical protein
VRSDRAYRSLSLRLHDYFIARSIDLLKPGASRPSSPAPARWTRPMLRARAHREVGRPRRRHPAARGQLPRDAGTDVVVDILFFRKRKRGAEGDQSWLDTDEVRPATTTKARSASTAGSRAIPIRARHARTDLWSLRRDLHMLPATARTRRGAAAASSPSGRSMTASPATST